MASRKRSVSNDANTHTLHKEWDDAMCPICMDHPHNAVLLLCSSHEKGCQSYICDTSYRHSNCLDRFKKLRDDNRNSPPLNLLHREQQSFEMQEGILEIGGSMSLQNNIVIEETNTENLSESKSSLNCPMCRGKVLSWKVVEEARKYLNLMPRGCSRESCSFFGNYRELRRHARRVHPTARPADIDPSRQRAWRNLEHEREYNDIVSAIRSAMPGAIVLGDYVIENGDRLSGERERGSGEGNRSWLPTFFLFQMIRSMDAVSDARDSRSRASSRLRRPARAFSRRRLPWGERLLDLQEGDNNNDDHDDEEEGNLNLNILSDTDEDAASPNPRRRRRLTRFRSEDQS